MKGMNKIQLNKATMIEALQKYFDNVMYRDVPEVSDVHFKMTTDGDYFEITFTEKPPEPKS